MFSSYPVLSSVYLNYVNTNKQTSCPTFAAENSKPAFLTLDVLVLEHKRDCVGQHFLLDTLHSLD